jgi:hypothetical protein
MALSDWSSKRLEQLRRWILYVLVFGLLGTETELVLLEHYCEFWQLVPLFLITLAIACVVWHAMRNDTASLRTLQIVMLLFLVAGFAGVALHFRGAAAFALDTNPSIDKWALVKKVMRTQAPPVLAPGVMLQLGLIGLAYAFSDSLIKRSSAHEGKTAVDRSNS